MNDESRRAIEAECQRLLAYFAVAIDDHNADAVVQTFAPDGVWHHQGEALAGRDAIHRAVVKRAADLPHLITRHHYGNIAIRVIDESHAEARAYYTVYRHDGDGDIALPRTGFVTRIGEYVDSFVLTGEGWKIASKRGKRVFEQT